LARLRRITPYLVELEGGLEAAVVAYCFAHAGAGASWTRALAPVLPSEWGICAVLLPGREARFSETLAPDVGTVVTQVAEEIADVHPRGRTAILYGQSLGALLAFEVGRTVETFAALIVLGAPAPSTTPPVERSGDDRNLLRALSELGAGDLAALEDERLMSASLDALRGDMHLYESYEWGNDRTIGASLISVRGTDDTVVTRAAAAAWAAASRVGCFRLLEVPGGHLPTADAAGAWVPHVERLVASEAGGD
jgi:surfactin synthase thioesterase subunit